MKLFRILAVAALAMFAGANAQAGVVLLSNLGSAGTEDADGAPTAANMANGNTRYAVKFTVGSNGGTIDQIRGVFSTNSDPGANSVTMTLSLFSDVAGDPGVSLGTSGTANLTNTRANIGFTFGSPLSVTANTTYWIVASNIDATYGASWYADFDSMTAYNASGFTGSNTSKRNTSFPTGGWSNNTGLGFAVLGTVNGGAVPEPALTSLLCLGGVALIRRRMKK